MYRTFEQLPAYLIVVSLAMAGLKVSGHIPELTWAVVVAPALALPALVCVVVLAFALAIWLVSLVPAVRSFSRTTPTTPQE